ncbi:MAG: pitrilysin family protein [Bacteroidales bacterium]|nr:pitrilysin family protein [Bacteroidales bacterium]
MIINRTTLPNGLRLVHCQLRTTQMVAVNVLYRVGSRNETPERTGFAHLFEHLMFGGTERYPDYDGVLQQAQGDNNAYTTQDYTNYYIMLPAKNLRLALDIELDRMAGLAFTPHSLEVQRKVVMEEFKQTCINQPYGDVQHLMARLSFGTPTPDGQSYVCRHPYSWPVIGLELSHIADATMEQVKDFFHEHYRPDNAILVVTGNVEWEELESIVFQTPPPALPKWREWSHHSDSHFTPSPWGGQGEGSGMSGRFQSVHRPVPQPLLLMSFYIPPRKDPDFQACDMLSDVLANGKSSRLYHRLVEEKRLFLSVDASVDGRLGTGQLYIEAIPADGISMDDAEAAVWHELEALQNDLISDKELQKQKNKYETNTSLYRSDYQRLAEQLAFFEMLGDARWILDDIPLYQAVTAEHLRDVARRIFSRENACVLHYLCDEDS